MADPTTPNRNYATPSHGSNVDTWDQPLNANFGLIDNNLGGLATVSLSNADVTLNASQYQCGTIRLVGTLTADLGVYFPAVAGWWTIDNQTTGAFNFGLRITGSSGQIISVPPGVATDIYLDGTNVKYRNFGKVGDYWDYAGSSVPRWLQFCTVAPYLLCDGTTFNGTTYPYLAQILGGTTLPDLRGGLRATLNQGTGRITTAGSGINGDALLSRGGSQLSLLGAANLPNYGLNVQVSGSITVNSTRGDVGIYTNPSSTGGGAYPFGAVNQGGVTLTSTGSATWGGNTSSINGGVAQSSFSNMPPTTIGGITMIRAA